MNDDRLTEILETLYKSAMVVRGFGMGEAINKAKNAIETHDQERLQELISNTLIEYHAGEQTAIIQDKFWEGKQRGAQQYATELKKTLGLEEPCNQ